MTRASITLWACSLASLSMAQNEEDALRIATMQPGGSARSNGMANAFGALGVDPASIAINPAGFGLCRGSELSITTVIEVNNSTTDHYGTNTSGTQTRGAINNLALILNIPSKEASAWRSATFGIVYDRKQSHHWSTEADAPSVPSTILQGFADEAEGVPYTTIYNDLPFSAGLAWDAFAIDTVPGSSSSYVPFPFGPETNQRHSIETHGATNQTSFFYSGNYMDRLYVGVSMGITGHKFERSTRHAETSKEPSFDLGEVVYQEDLTTSGNGFDVKVGALVRITDRFRAGAAFHSPQWMQLNDAYSMELRTTFRTPDNNGDFAYTAASPDGTFAYRLTTPWRLSGSAAYLAGTNGAVNIDYEFADMRAMQFGAANELEDLYDFKLENDLIKDRFRAVHSVRVGTEWRFGNWYYRAGWGIVPNAYRTTDAMHAQALKTYAAGLGYRGEHFTVDLGLNYCVDQTRFFQYASYLVDATTEDRTSYKTFFTIAYRP